MALLATVVPTDCQGRQPMKTMAEMVLMATMVLILTLTIITIDANDAIVALSFKYGDPGRDLAI